MAQAITSFFSDSTLQSASWVVGLGYIYNTYNLAQKPVNVTKFEVEKIQIYSMRAMEVTNLIGYRTFENYIRIRTFQQRC